MDVSEQLTFNQSPNHYINTLNFSQQLFLEDAPSKNVVKQSNLKVFPIAARTDVLILKDKIRKKLVLVELVYKEQNFDNILDREESRNCRVCLTDDDSSEMVVPCSCKGSAQFIHENCLKVWIIEKQGIEKVFQNELVCEVCNTKLLTETEAADQLMPRLILKAPKPKKICWTIEVAAIVSIIGGISALLYMIVNGNTESYMFAATTILLILLILFSALFYVSLLEQMTIEVLRKWKFKNFDERRRRSSIRKQSQLLANEQDLKGSVISSPTRKPNPRSQRPSLRNQSIQIIQLNQIPP